MASDNLKDTKVSFRPVKTTETELEQIGAQKGYLYFTTDTQKIYLGMGHGEKLSMGGNTGIYYANKEINYPEDGTEPEKTVYFSIDEIETKNGKLPAVDDLILNTNENDGCFYRVIGPDTEDEFSVETLRLTLRGSGGAGGGGGGTAGGATFQLMPDTNGYKRYYSQDAEELKIGLKALSTDPTNYISLIECSFDRNMDNIFYTIPLEHPVESVYEIDLIKQKDEFSEKTKSVWVRITDRYGTQVKGQYYITLVKLELVDNNLSPIIYIEDTHEEYFYTTPSGSNIINDLKIGYHFYDNEGVEIAEYYMEQKIDSTDLNHEVSKKFDNKILSRHGSYQLKVVLTGTISGGIVIRSNEIHSTVVRYLSDIGLPIFSYLAPVKQEQYTNIDVKYLLANGEDSQSHTMDIYVDEELVGSQTIVSGQIQTYSFSFDIAKDYEVNLQINDLGISEFFTLTVKQYTGVLPVIKVDHDHLKMYLTAKGRSNTSADKEYWPEYRNSSMRGVLKDFYYRSINGWMVDENGVNYLKVSQGAKVEYNEYSPYSEDPNKSGLVIELDFRINSVFDYSSNLIECLSKDNTDEPYSGFVIQGDTFKYYAASFDKEGNAIEILSLNLTQNKRIRLSFAVESANREKYPMCYTYLDGIISNVINYSSSADFANANKPGYLKIDSTGGDIDIYSIRFYNTYLDESIILNNYQASLGSLTERQKNYESNAIRDKYGDISLSEIENENYNLQIPYVKIYGGYVSDKDFNMAKYGESNVPSLPIGKKTFKAIDIEVHYPTEKQNPYFKGYEDFILKTTFEDPTLNVLNGFGQQAKTGAIMYAQGTSSLEYPVKNLRVKFKGKKIKVRPDLEPVKLVTFKADFMESSGSHNTGTANFVDAAYNYAGMSTPSQDHYKDESIVTCIKGHPCIIFWNPGYEEERDKEGNLISSRTLEDIPENYHFIGKYNLNLDKETPEPFGFKHDNSDFGYLSPGDEYYQVLYYDEKNPDKPSWVGQLNPSEDGDYYPNQTETKAIVQEGEKVNSIHCFEFLDNNVKVCNFLSQEGYTYEETWYNKFLNDDSEMVPGWTLGFESRYPKDRVGTHDADMLWPLASWLNGLYYKYQRELANGKKPSDINYIYDYTIAESYDENSRYFEKISDDEYEEIPLNLETFISNYYYTRKTINTIFAMESLQEFRDRYQEFLDPEFLLAYYVITEALLMADSRVKNMMIATWGKEHRTFEKSDGTKVSVFNYIWYPIFYDMDTMLGLDNIGYVNKNYYDEDTQEDVFNGDEVLWKIVRDALPNEVAQFYNKLENSSSILTKNSILPYFNNNQATMANETFYNEDAFYKYIDTFRNGYTNHLTNEIVMPGSGTRLYAAQGSRAMMREWFIDNRLKYLRGKYNSTLYQDGDRVEFRLTYPTYDEAEPGSRQDKINKSIVAVPPSGNFDFTSVKTGYAGVKIGKNSTPVNARFVDAESKTIVVDTSSGNGTETYLLGLSNLSSVGDLSDKYLYKLNIGTTENNLKSLILGNHKKDYYNPYWSNEPIELGGFNFLEEFNLENCETFTGSINFTDSPQIKKILLNGSTTTSITLPVGGVLEELRLPTSITNLEIDSHPTLTNDKFTVGYFDYDQNKYVKNYKLLRHILIKGIPNIDTYEIVRQGLLESEEIRLTSYCFQDFVWNITNANELTYNKETGNIDGIKVLDILSTQINPYSGYGTYNALVGTININVSNKVVNEFDLYQKYHGTYPNVIFKYGNDVIVDGAPEIIFYNIESKDLTENSAYWYRVLSNEKLNLKQLTSKEGPAGSALGVPIKTDTNEYSYDFNGNWEVIESSSPGIAVGQIIHVNEFENIIPKGNLKFTPIFNEIQRKYEVILYNYDGTELDRANLPWGIQIEDGFYELNKVSGYYNYRECLDDDYRWEFDGWQSESDFNENKTNLTYPLGSDEWKKKVVSGRLKLYAHYKYQDCTSVVSNLNYFSFTTGTNNTDVILTVKDKYKSVLQGKITLPKYNENGKEINELGIGFLSGNKNITHIYFVNDPQGFPNFRRIEKDSFKNCENLETIINLPPSITYIGIDAFNKCLKFNISTLPSQLNTIMNGCFEDCSNLTLEYLPDNLKTIGNRAFQRCTKLALAHLPMYAETVGEFSFKRCPNIKIYNFATLTSGSKLISIGKEAFMESGQSVGGSITIGYNEKETVCTIADGAFTDYGHSQISCDIIIIGSVIQCNPELLGFKNVSNMEVV